MSRKRLISTNPDAKTCWDILSRMRDVKLASSIFIVTFVVPRWPTVTRSSYSGLPNLGSRIIGLVLRARRQVFKWLAIAPLNTVTVKLLCGKPKAERIYCDRIYMYIESEFYYSSRSVLTESFRFHFLISANSPWIAREATERRVDHQEGGVVWTGTVQRQRCRRMVPAGGRRRW